MKDDDEESGSGSRLWALSYIGALVWYIILILCGIAVFMIVNADGWEDLTKAIGWLPSLIGRFFGFLQDNKWMYFVGPLIAPLLALIAQGVYFLYKNYPWISAEWRRVNLFYRKPRGVKFVRQMNKATNEAFQTYKRGIKNAPLNADAAEILKIRESIYETPTAAEIEEAMLKNLGTNSDVERTRFLREKLKVSNDQVTNFIADTQNFNGSIKDLVRIKNGKYVHIVSLAQDVLNLDGLYQKTDAYINPTNLWATSSVQKVPTDLEYNKVDMQIKTLNILLSHARLHAEDLSIASDIPGMLQAQEFDTSLTQGRAARNALRDVLQVYGEAGETIPQIIERLSKDVKGEGNVTDQVSERFKRLNELIATAGLQVPGKYEQFDEFIEMGDAWNDFKSFTKANISAGFIPPFYGDVSFFSSAPKGMRQLFTDFQEYVEARLEKEFRDDPAETAEQKESRRGKLRTELFKQTFANEANIQKQIQMLATEDAFQELWLFNGEEMVRVSDVFPRNGISNGERVKGEYPNGFEKYEEFLRGKNTDKKLIRNFDVFRQVPGSPGSPSTYSEIWWTQNGKLDGPEVKNLKQFTEGDNKFPTFNKKELTSIDPSSYTVDVDRGINGFNRAQPGRSGSAAKYKASRGNQANWSRDMIGLWSKIAKALS